MDMIIDKMLTLDGSITGTDVAVIGESEEGMVELDD